MTTRYVILQFDDDPVVDEAMHPADNFLSRFGPEGSGWLNADVGATCAMPAQIASTTILGVRFMATGVVYPPQGPPSRGWLDEI